MSEITCRITWSLYLEHEEIENSTDEFTQKNFVRLINFLDLCNDCITYYFKGSGMVFLCDNQQAAYALIRRIHNLANKKTKDFEIKDIKVNGPATIVFWADGTKTVVQCGAEDLYDAEKAVAMCFMKKALGGRSMHKLFDLAEDRAAEYDNKFKRLEYVMPEDKDKE